MVTPRKLIDFDSSYIVGSPPPPDEIVGTMNFYSPELVQYIQGDADGAALTGASDVFALGLIYAEYLTGALPPFDPRHHEAAIAVLNGARLKVSDTGLPPALVDLVESMLRADPRSRPTVPVVHATLMGLGGRAATTAKPARVSPDAASALRGKGLRLVAPPTDPPTPAPATPSSGSAPAATSAVSRLVGRLLSSVDKRLSK